MTETDSQEWRLFKDTFSDGLLHISSSLKVDKCCHFLWTTKQKQNDLFCLKYASNYNNAQSFQRSFDHGLCLARWKRILMKAEKLLLKLKPKVVEYLAHLQTPQEIKWAFSLSVQKRAPFKTCTKKYIV